MKIVLMSVLFAFLLTGGYSQENKGVKSSKKNSVPDLVKKSFSAKFPDATKVRWGVEKPGEYEAEFIIGKSEMSANYNDQGELLETETEISATSIPDAVKTTFDKDFKTAKILEVSKVESKGMITYELEVKNGKNSLELVYDSTGKLLKNEKLKERKD